MFERGTRVKVKADVRTILPLEWRGKQLEGKVLYHDTHDELVAVDIENAAQVGHQCASAPIKGFVANGWWFMENELEIIEEA